MTTPRPTADPDVVDDTDHHRFEIRSGPEVAGFAVYEPGHGTVTFTHTEIGPAFDGQGLGSRLARAALDDVRARGLKAIPVCPFIAGWIRRHPEYVDLVDAGHRADLEPT